MKTILEAIALVLLCTLLSFNVRAQTELTLENPSLDIDFTISPTDLAKIKAPAGSEAVALPQPLLLKHPKNGKCYAFGCTPEAGCEDCVLLWKDRNGNGQINPRGELRCRCKSDAEKSCRVRVQEVKCPD